MSSVTVKDKEELLELPFDQFQRYRAVSEFADSIRPNEKSQLKILDVGGYPGLITDFLPDDDITIVDVIPGDMPNYHQYEGDKLPFEDASYDLVCSCDTLEHVPAPDRQAFLSELARVSKDHILITAPFDDPRTCLAEEILFSYVLRVLRTEFTTLKEHIDNGLPNLLQTTGWLKEIGVETSSFPSGYLYHWLPMMVAKHHLMAHADTEELHRRVDKFYNLGFSLNDHRQPSYRHILVGSKSGDSRSADFCKARHISPEEDAPAVDFSRLQLFKMMTDILDVDLKHDISELVDQLKSSTQEELAESKRMLDDRDNQIEDLKSIISAQNQSLDELHALVARIRKFFPYRVYKRLFKQEKLP